MYLAFIVISNDNSIFMYAEYLLHQTSHNWKRVCLSLRSLARECSKQGMDVKKFDSTLSRRKEPGSPDKNSVVQRYMDQLQSNSLDNAVSMN